MTLHIQTGVAHIVDCQLGIPCLDLVKSLCFLVYLQIICLGDRAKEVHLELMELIKINRFLSLSV